MSVYWRKALRVASRESRVNPNPRGFEFAKRNAGPYSRPTTHDVFRSTFIALAATLPATAALAQDNGGGEPTLMHPPAPSADDQIIEFSYFDSTPEVCRDAATLAEHAPPGAAHALPVGCDAFHTRNVSYATGAALLVAGFLVAYRVKGRPVRSAHRAEGIVADIAAKIQAAPVTTVGMAPNDADDPLVAAVAERSAGPASSAPPTSPANINPYQNLTELFSLSRTFLERVCEVRDGHPQFVPTNVLVQELALATVCIARLQGESFSMARGETDIFRECVIETGRQMIVFLETLVEAIKAERGEPDALLEKLQILREYGSTASKEGFADLVYVIGADRESEALWARITARVARAYDSGTQSQDTAAGDAGEFAVLRTPQLVDRTAVEQALERFHGEPARREEALVILQLAAERMKALNHREGAVRLQALAAFLRWKLHLPATNPETDIAEFIACFDGDHPAAIARWLQGLEQFGCLRAEQAAAQISGALRRAPQTTGDGGVAVVVAPPATNAGWRARATLQFIAEFTTFLDRFSVPSHNRSDVIVDRFHAGDAEPIPADFFADCADDESIEQRVVATVIHLLRDHDESVRPLAVRVARMAVDEMIARVRPAESATPKILTAAPPLRARKFSQTQRRWGNVPYWGKFAGMTPPTLQQLLTTVSTEPAETRSMLRLRLLAELMAHHLRIASVETRHRLSELVQRFLAIHNNGYNDFESWIVALEVLRREGFASVEQSPFAPLVDLLFAHLPEYSLAAFDTAAAERERVLSDLQRKPPEREPRRRALYYLRSRSRTPALRTDDEGGDA